MWWPEAQALVGGERLQLVSLAAALVLQRHAALPALPSLPSTHLHPFLARGHDSFCWSLSGALAASHDTCCAASAGHSWESARVYMLGACGSALGSVNLQRLTNMPCAYEGEGTVPAGGAGISEMAAWGGGGRASLHAAGADAVRSMVAWVVLVWQGAPRTHGLAGLGSCCPHRNTGPFFSLRTAASLALAYCTALWLAAGMWLPECCSRAAQGTS